MGADEVLYDVDGNVATITLNRPERMNAATFDMADQFRELLGRADADRQVRAIVLTGAGRAFCSGDDVEAAWGDPRMEATLAELSSVRPPLTPEVGVLRDCTKPIVAAVNGPALGIGMDFAVWADVRIAAESASFGQLFVKMGLTADVTGLWLLPRIIGHGAAAEMLYTGSVIDAARALEIGLVSWVVPDDELMTEASKLAGRIAANAPLALQHIKEGLRRAQASTLNDLDDLGAYVGSSLARLFQSKDHREAAAAFMEKRKPTFTGE